MISCIRDIYVLLSVATSWRRKKKNIKRLSKASGKETRNIFIGGAISRMLGDFNAANYGGKRCDAAMLEPRHEISILPASVPFPGRYVTRIPTILKPIPRIVELHCKNNRKYTYKWKMFFSGKDGNDQSWKTILFTCTFLNDITSFL